LTPEAKRLNRLCYLNRQPSLWRHSVPCVEIIPGDDDDLSIGLSPLVLEPMNADHDGDELALYVINDQQALKEMEEKAFLKNSFFYDSDGSMLTTVRHEALYACYILTETTEPDFENFKTIKIFDLKDLPEDFNYWNNYLKCPVEFKDKIYTYGVCLLNKWMELDDILINQSITKKQTDNISRIIYEIHKDKFHDVIAELNKKLFFFISTTDFNPTIDVDEMVNMVDQETEDLFKKLPDSNVELGYYINNALVDRCIQNMNHKSSLYRLYRSGSRMSKQQLARTCINVGYVADAKNVIISDPICTNLMIGLDEDDYFKSSPGARKGKQ
jgi:DNA-directed RNA polymerase beta' subunit